MNVQKVENIIRVVDGDECSEGLATLAQAVIQVAHAVGYSKEDVIRSMASQWDAYALIGSQRLH